MRRGQRATKPGVPQVQQRQTTERRRTVPLRGTVKRRNPYGQAEQDSRRILLLGSFDPEEEHCEYVWAFRPDRYRTWLELHR